MPASRFTPSLSHALAALAIQIGALWVTASASQSTSQAEATTKHATLVPTQSAPKIDGKLDDAAWQNATVINDLVQIKPGDGTPPSERTEIYVTFDKDALYIGARFWDRAGPDGIAITAMKQNQELRADDRLAVIIDPFNTGRNGYRFETNVNGVRNDLLYQGNQLQPEWNVIWEAGGQLTDEGWSAEMAIPFKTLPFDPRIDSWGFNFSRAIRRNNEESVWVSRNRNWAPNIFGTLSGLQGMDNGVGLDVVPGLSLTRRSNHVTGVHDSEVDPSLDLYYRITPALTGSLTINTDFSASEVDDRQVNLTRFNLFFPEKRDFFLNDADLFEFGRIGLSGYLPNQRSITRTSQENARPFFSRRIGLSPAGTPVALDYGGKLSGRVGRFTVGMLAVRQDEFMAPGTRIDAGNAFIGRVTADVLAESSVGMIATSGNFNANSDNSLVGADFLYTNTHLPGNRTLEADVWLQKSHTPGLQQRDTATGIAMRLPTTAGLRFGMSAKQIEENFRPALGFVSRVGVREYDLDTGYSAFLKNSRWPIQSMSSGIDAYRADLIDAGLQTQILTLRPVELTSRSNDLVKFFVARSTEILQQPFFIYRDGSRALSVPTGRYRFTDYGFDLEAAGQRVLSGKFNVRHGDFYDGTRLNLGGELTWKQSRYVRLKAGYDWNDISLPRGDVIIRLMRASAEINFNTQVSWTTLAQYDTVSAVIGMQSRLQWIPLAGREVLLVFSHNMQDLDRNDSFTSLNTELNAKASYTFRF